MVENNSTGLLENIYYSTNYTLYTLAHKKSITMYNNYVPLESFMDKIKETLAPENKGHICH